MTMGECEGVWLSICEYDLVWQLLCESMNVWDYYSDNWVSVWLYDGRTVWKNGCLRVWMCESKTMWDYDYTRVES